MTLIDLTNVRDLTVVDPRTGSSEPRGAAARVECGCHDHSIEVAAERQERARG